MFKGLLSIDYLIVIGVDYLGGLVIFLWIVFFLSGDKSYEAGSDLLIAIGFLLDC